MILSMEKAFRSCFIFISIIAIPIISIPAALAQSHSGDEVDQNSVIHDIVVTAQRRSERLSEVPISITALSNETLVKTGIADVRSMTFVTPGLSFQSLGSSAQPVLRGVGSTSSSVGDGSNVPIYIDGVYQPYQGSNHLRLVDLERVEVLKGPQGTLYGRNAAGGAIVITTLAPAFTPSGRVGLNYARFGEFEASGYVTAPIVADKIAFNLTGQYIHTDGFRKDINLDKTLGYLRSRSVRGKLLLKPSETVSILLGGHYARRNDLSTFGNQPLEGNTRVRSLSPGILIPTKKNTSALDITPSDVTKNVGFNMKIDMDLGNATLTSLSAYDKYDEDIVVDSDLTPATFSHTRSAVNVKAFTQDLTLTSSSTAPFEYLLGASYYRESSSVEAASFGGSLVTIPNPPMLFRIRADVDTEAWGFFGEASYRFTDQLRFTAGLRYSTEVPRFVGNPFVIASGSFGPDVRSDARRFKKLTPKASLQYKFTDTINAYASYSRGFKSGALNPLALQVAPVDPETIDAYEIGVKGVPNRKLSFDAAAYYYDYKDLQFQAFGSNFLSPILTNAASARIYGFEANATVLVAQGLTVRSGLAYTHGEYSRFARAQIFTPAVDGAGVPIGGNVSSLADVSGNRLIRTPRLQVNGTISYETPVGNGGLLQTNLTGSYVSRQNYDLAGNFGQKGFSIFNANLAYTMPDGHWRGTLFGTNIFDAKPIAGILISASSTSVTYWKPATYGVRLEYLF